MAFECPLMICDVGVDVFCFVFNSGELKKTPSKKEAPERFFFFLRGVVWVSFQEVSFTVGSHDTDSCVSRKNHQWFFELQGFICETPRACGKLTIAMLIKTTKTHTHNTHCCRRKCVARSKMIFMVPARRAVISNGKNETNVFQIIYVRSQVKSELFGIPTIPRLSGQMAQLKSLFKRR